MHGISRRQRINTLKHDKPKDAPKDKQDDKPGKEEN